MSRRLVGKTLRIHFPQKMEWHGAQEGFCGCQFGAGYGGKGRKKVTLALTFTHLAG